MIQNTFQLNMNLITRETPLVV